LGKTDGHNCDDHNYFPESGVDLRAGNRHDDNYIRAIRRIALQEADESHIDKCLYENNVGYDADVFLEAALKDN
jgi:hypothetical protein